MSGTNPTDQTGTSGAAPGGGGSGSTSVGGSTSGLTGASTLPPQYSTGNLGFFTRQTESVPTAITTGPDGALYVSELNGIPYPSGYSSIYRISDPAATTGFDGTTPSGVPQAYASGFSEVNGLAFNNSTGDMFVLEYNVANEVYDPTIAPADLAPSTLIQVKADGTRTTISGPELHLGNYVTVNQQTGDVYVAIDNQGPATATSPGTGEVLDYKQDPTTGAWSNTVIASGLNSPRGMAFGPDGNLYVLEQGTGTPNGAPGADTAPVIPFIPGLVSERGGTTGSITKVDITSPAGGQQTVLTGLSSFREFNPDDGPGPRHLHRHERPDHLPGRHGVHRRGRRPRTRDRNRGRPARQRASGRAQGRWAVRLRPVPGYRDAAVQLPHLRADERPRRRHDPVQH